MHQLNTPSRAHADSWIFVAWTFLILWAPLPMGSVLPWAHGLLESWILLLTISWLVLRARGRVRFSRPLAALKPVLLLLIGWLLLIGFQLLPLPPLLLDLLTPESTPHYRTAMLEGAGSRETLTLHPNLTAEHFFKTGAYLCFLALSVALLNSSRRIRITLAIVIASGVFQAFYGGLVSLHNNHIATGTFVDRNHLGGYLVMCLSLGIGLLVAEANDTTMVSWRHRAISFVSWLASPKMLLRVALALMVVTLVLTRSRGGNSAFFLGLIAMSGAWFYITRKQPSILAMVIVASVLIVDIVILGEWFGIEQVVQRIQETRLETETRTDVYRESLAYLRDYMVLGSGLGSFTSMFPQYRTEGSFTGNLYIMHAHNDYLEFAIEGGLIGFTLLAAVAILALRTSWRAMATRHRSLLRGLGVGSFMGLVAILYQSLTEFNLRIPSNALMFMLLIALAYVGAYHRGGHSTADQVER